MLKQPFITALLFGTTCSLSAYAADDLKTQSALNLPTTTDYHNVVKTPKQRHSPDMMSRFYVPPEVKQYSYDYRNDIITSNYKETAKKFEKSLLQSTPVAAIAEEDLDSSFLDMYRASASRGNVADQYKLGIQYLFGGLGQQADPTQAFDWIRKSALKGYAPAQLQLGTMYLEGIGIEQNPETAYEWFKQAAEQGNADAQLYTGVLSLEGLGTAKDRTVAITWFEKAATQGNEDAQRLLAENRKP